MLILFRRHGEEVEITHGKSGDKLTIVAYSCARRSVKLGFMDESHHFDIMRPEAQWKEKD